MDACVAFAACVRARAGTALVAGPHDLQELQESERWRFYSAFVLTVFFSLCA